MADNLSKETRSYNMSRIRSKNTRPEMLVRKFLHSEGYRYRLHVKDLPGKPDIILPKYKAVIFIHGCFWHSHQNCKYSVTPKSNLAYWIPKLERNITKDAENETKLLQMGWNIIKIWECALKPKHIVETLQKLVSKLNDL